VIDLARNMPGDKVFDRKFKFDLRRLTWIDAHGTEWR